VLIKYRSERLKGREYLKDIGVDGTIRLKVILENRIWWCGLGSSGLGYGPVAGSCKHFI
jgi:hypothetical protein